MPPLRKNGKPKQPKTKTFSGCWTCRRRKVKCDATTPACLRCKRASLLCAGYGLELYWVTGFEDVAPSAIKRRARAIDLPIWSFDLDSVDEHLEDLDEVSSNASCQDQTRGAFGVFQAYSVDPESPSNPAADYHEFSDDNEAEYLPLVSQTQQGTNAQDPRLYWNFGRTCLDDPLIGSLLGHYIDDVCMVLTPLQHPDNPYSSIHFPKALAGASELTPAWSYSTQTPAKTSVAVFYAVMATAAFHLSSKGITTGLAMQETARSYRAKALSAIRHALQTTTESSPEAQPETHQCEGILSAMFALITLDVVEGSMTEFYIHLSGIAQLREKWNIDSPEIDRLMNIHLFLTTIARSTSIVELPQPWYESSINLPSVQYHPPSASDGLIFTYGISTTLLQIMHCMVTISEHLAYYVQQRREHPAGLRQACDDSYSTLLRWFGSHEATQNIPSAEPDPVQSLRARFNLLAFAHAMKVYYHTRILPCSSVETKLYVREVAHCLTQIELLKSEGNASKNTGVTISWPGFVASCEAERGKERDVWYQWWENMTKYGIGNISRLWEVVQEAWRLRDEGYQETPAWMPVLRQGGFRILAV